MGTESKQGVDLLIETIQYGQSYIDADGRQVLSDDDFVKLTATINGQKVDLKMSPGEADTVARVLSETASRLRRAMHRPDIFPALRFIRTAFRLDAR